MKTIVFLNQIIYFKENYYSPKFASFYFRADISRTIISREKEKNNIYFILFDYLILFI
jgi:hypothetical protein